MENKPCCGAAQFGHWGVNTNPHPESYPSFLHAFPIEQVDVVREIYTLLELPLRFSDECCIHFPNHALLYKMSKVSCEPDKDEFWLRYCAYLWPDSINAHQLDKIYSGK